MDPQEVQTELDQAESKEDKLEGEAAESAEASRPPDDDTGEAKQGTPTGSASHKNPPLPNGTSL